MIFLFTDFGAADIYVGQVKSVLAQIAPGIPVVDLLNDAPRFAIRSSAHLLASMALRLPSASVTLAVVDPAVGTDRKPIALRCAGGWFVGPDNGLLSVLAARHADAEVLEIVWKPKSLSLSFHGRDLFAPVAARLAAGRSEPSEFKRMPGMDIDWGASDLAEVIYIDHYGNAITGLRAGAIDRTARLTVRGQSLHRAEVFALALANLPFWYVNSIGLVEIAYNQRSAADTLGIRVGDEVVIGDAPA